MKTLSEEDIDELFHEVETIAVVGLSDKPDRPSYRVADYLKEQGYKIIPVNPNIGTALEEKAYPSLNDVDTDIDAVVIFRRPEEVAPIVDDAIKKHPKLIWMQEGIVHEAAAQKAHDAGIKVVMDRCIMIAHQKHSRFS